MEIIEQAQKSKKVEIEYDAIGWKSLLQQKGGTSKILVLKTVVRGLCLERGMPIYSYIGEDSESRPVMVSYLDAKPRILPKHRAINYCLFLGSAV